MRANEFLYEVLFRGTENGGMAWHVSIGRYVTDPESGERTFQERIISMQTAIAEGIDLSAIGISLNEQLAAEAEIQRQKVTALEDNRGNIESARIAELHQQNAVLLSRLRNAEASLAELRDTTEIETAPESRNLFQRVWDYVAG